MEKHQAELMFQYLNAMPITTNNPQKQNRISDLPKLSMEVMENIFNVYQDTDGKYFYNLLQTLVFPQNLPPAMFTSYNTQGGDTWPLISYKQYKTPNLWWIILLANNILDATKIPKPGFKLRIPVFQVVQEIANQIAYR